MPLISMLAWLILAFVVVIAAVARYLLAINGVIQRNKYLRQELRPGSPLGLPGLDAGKLGTATRELESLGFIKLQDYLPRLYSSREAKTLAIPPIADPIAAPQPVQGAEPQNFLRVMAHPETGCLARIHFISSLDLKRAGLSKGWLVTNFISINGTGAEDWVYSTTDRDFAANVEVFWNLNRHPRWLSTRRPDDSVEALYYEHLSRRDRIAQTAGLVWKRNLTTADDAAIDERNYANFRTFYEATSPATFFWKALRQNQAKIDSEWLGELQGRVPDAG
jgi:hypothetical protein